MAAVVVGKPLSMGRKRLAESRTIRETKGSLGSVAFFHPQPSIRMRMTFFAAAAGRSASRSRRREVPPVSQYSKVPGRPRKDSVGEGGLYLSPVDGRTSGGIAHPLSCGRPIRQRTDRD